MMKEIARGSKFFCTHQRKCIIHPYTAIYNYLYSHTKTVEPLLWHWNERIWKVLWNTLAKSKKTTISSQFEQILCFGRVLNNLEGTRRSPSSLALIAQQDCLGTSSAAPAVFPSMWKAVSQCSINKNILLLMESKGNSQSPREEYENRCAICGCFMVMLHVGWLITKDANVEMSDCHIQ